MNDEVRSQLQGALQVGGEEGVVHRHPGAAAMGDFRDGGDVRDVHHRIGGGLEEDHLRLGPERRLDRGEIRGVHPGEGKTQALQQAGEVAEGAAVDVPGYDGVIAGLEHRHQRLDGRHAGSEGVTGVSPFQRRHLLFESAAGGVLNAGVFELRRLAELMLDVGGGLVDGNGHRAGTGVRLLAGMDGAG